MTTALPECTPERVHLRIIGPMTIIVADGERHGRALGAPKTRMLLELLVAERGNAVPKDELVDALWPGGRALPADPARTLEHYMCVLRAALTTDRQLGHRAIVTRPSSYLLDPVHFDIDADHFTSLVRRAATATSAERRRLLEAAVVLGDGDLFADSPLPARAEPHRATHRESVSWAHLVLATDALSEFELHRAVWHAEQALRFTPCAEHAYHLLMVAQVGLGERDLSRLTHQRCVTTLSRDLGLAPTALTDMLRHAVEHGAGPAEMARLLVPVAAA
ncbi:MAG: AfsR/SARP family transcriptional regulator [Ilumatobacteraceae bacterium]